MKIQVKMKNLEMISEDYGPRVCEVKSNKSSFMTPTRALSSQEARAYMKTSTVISPLENPIYEHVTALDMQEFKRISKKNGTLAEMIAKINSLKSKHQESKLTIFFPMRRNRDIQLEKDDMIGIVDLQTLGGFDLVSIPDYWVRTRRPEAVGKDIENMFDRAAAFGKVGVPYVDPDRDLDSFSRQLELLLDRGYPIVGIEYASIVHKYANFRVLAEAAKKAEKTIFHMSRTSPYSRSSADGRVSPALFAGLFGIDSVCVAVLPPMGGSNTRKVDSIRRFTPSTAGVLSKVEYEAEGMLRTKDCNCPVCVGKNIEEFYDVYSHRPSPRTAGRVDAGYLHQVSKVHEVFSSLIELEKVQKHIEHSEFKSQYLDKKRDMKDAYTKIPD